MLMTDSPRRRASALMAGALASLCLASSAVAAGLPQQASHTASAVLAKLGITVPGPATHSGQGNGGAVSALAKDGTLTGAAKGAAVSGLASGGKGHAGAHKAGAQTNHGKGADVSALATSTTLHRPRSAGRVAMLYEP